MATWAITYRDHRDEREVDADRIREAGNLLAFSNDYEEPFLYINNDIIDTIVLLDPLPESKKVSA